ncbi:KAP family P-loop NTPase fold protein [Vibrio parahaemolyticus]|uniref:KAP family P-loop NTPase fold protein n=1 Tax=Vibrio parahaemolyticus TaxID=670 RepID=UPI0006ACE417|nr:P-loop NTPase fold protein [Vibrio parahaemolyticus]OAR47380.1 hypothetical protein EM55_022760 [Vibrio parahaemolyticus]
MILKAREVEVLQSDPFFNDELNRKESAEILSEFILSSSDPMVLCLDAPWGQGKTTFLRMWEQHLKNREIPTIYFNAWENDFTDDAFVSLIGEIGTSIESLSINTNESTISEYYEKAKKVGLGLVKRSIPVATKVATAGALDLDKITEQALSSFAESVASDQIDKYENAKKTLKVFREDLSDFAKNVSCNGNKPLVFIIDELDRCRPNYAIEVLEKAKHFFNVPNIIFVLGADKVQLGHAIKAIYGSEINVNGYLRRFIDFDYLLAPPEKGMFVRALFEKYAFNSYFSSKTGNETRNEGQQALSMFTELFEVFDLTLREQEHCCSLLSLSIRTTPENYKLFPVFLCLLIVLKVKEPEVYKKFIFNEITPEYFLNWLEDKDSKQSLLQKNYGALLEAYIVASHSDSYVGSEITGKYVLLSESENSTELQKRRASRVLSILSQFEWEGGNGALPYLVKKIEVASRFGA